MVSLWRTSLWGVMVDGNEQWLHWFFPLEMWEHRCQSDKWRTALSERSSKEKLSLGYLIWHSIGNEVAGELRHLEFSQICECGDGEEAGGKGHLSAYLSLDDPVAFLVFFKVVPDFVLIFNLTPNLICLNLKCCFHKSGYFQISWKWRL